MLRKGQPGGSSTTTTTTSGTGLSSSPSSGSSRDLYHHSPTRHHHAHQYNIRSSRGESVAHQRATPPSSSSCTLEVRSSNSTPKRGGNISANTNNNTNTNQSHLSRTSSGSDISGGGVGGNSIPSGGGGVILRSSPSHHHRQSQQQQHCCGCACGSTSSPSSSNKGSRDNLLRNVVTRNNSPTRAHSPIHHHQVVQHTHSCCCANQHQQNQHLNHSTLVHRIRDCPVDSHPRLLTTTTSSNVNPSNQQLWLFGKDEGLDDEEDPNDSVGVGDERVVRRQDVVSAGPSHGCHHPSPLIVQSGASAQYNAGGGGAIGTPTNTNAGGFGFFKFQNPSSSVASPHPELLLPMDFIQVLIHQHAKTIVALQDLQREVSTLKDFRTSLLHSLPATAAPTAPSGLSDAVWTTGSAIGGVGVSSATTAAIATAPSSTTGAVGVGSNGVGSSSSSSAPKIPHPDSGFSTETKSTNQKSDAESDDELYSLLSLIQCKVQESIIRNDYLLTSHQNRTATSSHRSSSNHRRQGEKPKERLGKLDKVLGNCDKVEFRKDFISRDVIRGVLGAEKTELQRQLFFALVKIENLKSVTKEQKTVDSRVYALSQENEQLRYKLKEMEIELEGTKATLRILQKNSYSPASPSAAAALVISASKLTTSVSPSSTVLPEAPCHTSTPSHHHLHPSSRLVVPPTTWESDSLDNTDPADYAIPGATAVATIASSSANSTRQRLIQKLSDIESISTNSSSTHHHHSSSPTTNNNISRLSNNYCSNNSSSSGSGVSTSSKKSPAPKPPVIIENSIMNTTSSTSPSPSSNPNSATSKQQKSASPVGNKSMSSIKSNNSSIPIAVSRLKAKGGPGSTGPASNNNNNNNVAGTGKTTPVGKLKPGSGPPPAQTGNGGIGTIWANWFS